MSQEASCGQIIFHSKKLQQASCFFANSIPEDVRKNWLESLPKINLRDKFNKFTEEVLCVVLSQNCDIACNNDDLDDCIEIVLCQPIKAKKVFKGNQFVKSVRKLHFKFIDINYEANVDYIITVRKEQLLELIDQDRSFEILNLDQELQTIFPFWRANRYVRSALPDQFNNNIFPILNKYLEVLENISLSPSYPFSSFIKSFYVNLDSLEEKESYDFELFFLLRDETPNELIGNIQDIVEEFANELVEITQNNYRDVSQIYADTETNTSVKHLSNLIRFNVDYHSLQKGDNDFSEDV
ncbi:hypothetical protein [Acinetobacter oleivorans]|uniref:hypothetical protein n=1 Tax=Acinetobacter oleivorans TaxID=1148157 RepID=UPI00125FBCCD|nr:hypothetical protein [Acinetobacter oleivorans]